MIGRVINGVAAVVGAAVVAQFPEFYQQYVQRLGGRLDQSRRDIQRLLQDAETLGRTLEIYLQELLNSGTAAARQAAKRELERVDNADQLEGAYDALATAGPLERPLVFVKNFDSDLAEETMAIFSPAVPVSSEGFVYAGIGLVIALALVAGCEQGGRALARRINKRTGLSQPDGP